TNVLDWSCTSNIAVALGNLVYSWNSESGKCNMVPLNTEDSTTLVCSLAWAPNGSHLALGLDNGHILLWDVDKDQLLQLKSRRTCTHAGSVDVLAWAPDESALYSGQNCGCVQQIDQRTGVTSFTKLRHNGGVCGLKVSPDGHYLASGGTDHQLHVWHIHQKTTHQRIRAHNASIKAMAWCPWQSTVLATGGGLGDGYIRIWNINSGNKLAEVNTNSQICCMLWSSRHREIVTGHGCERHDVTLWSYPQLRPVATLSAHDGRVLFLALSPDGKTVASCGADEMLMLWKCFDSDPPLFRRNVPSLPCSSPLTRTIR
ncbi:cell division cycle 20, partial [Lamellibrachia satsuma]